MKSSRHFTPSLPTALVLYFFGLLLTLSITFLIAVDISYHKDIKQAQYKANNVSDYINSELARFQNIPLLLTSNYLIRAALTDNPNANHRLDDTLNQFLLDITQSSGANDLYVMDTRGIVIAASNYQLEKSFVGGDFAFRPYVSQALAGEDSAYYALGIKSDERGVFFSAPIRINQEIKGVIAVKIAITPFEQNTAMLTGDPKAQLIGFGQDKVVFMSNNAHWRLKQLTQDNPGNWHEILSSQRYLDLPQQALNQSTVTTPLGQPLWQIKAPSQQASTSRYSVALSELPVLDMQLAILLPYELFSPEILMTLLTSAVLYLCLVAALAFIYRRIAGYKRLLYTRHSLEQEIEIRTRELASTQDALIQSTKLATIGQLAASINHEINQPLSAISAYLVSSRRMLSKGQTESVVSNLLTIEALVHRTHLIVAQLKQFSRLESSGLQPIALQQSLDNALVILGPELKKQQVSLERDTSDAQVWAEPLKLEQVFVNLLSNAVEAMSHSSNKQLWLTIEVYQDRLDILIRDSGPGLDLQKIDTIFEPFYTTKSNHGSGLGLSISRNIIQSFGGSLNAANSPDGGAVFTLTLNLHPTPDKRS